MREKKESQIKFLLPGKLFKYENGLFLKTYELKDCSVCYLVDHGGRYEFDPDTYVQPISSKAVERLIEDDGGFFFGISL